MNDLSENRPACKSASEPFDLAAAYVHALTGTGGAPIDVRMLHETDKGEPAFPMRGTLSDLWSAIQSGQAEGRGAFVTVNQTDGKGRKAENIDAIRAVWIDLDGADAADQYAAACAFDPAPSFAVASSPGRWHVYWVLTPGCPLDLAASINRRLVSKFNGDRSASDIARVLRLPGSHHLKQPDTPHLVTCHQLSGFGHPVDCQALDTALADQPEHGGTGKRRSLGNPDLAAPSLHWLRRALALINPNELFREDWISFSAAWKQAGWSLTDDETLFAMWSDWCADYEKNDSSENDKQWRSIKQTEVGWPAILRRIPALRAEMAFGSDPAPIIGQPPAIASNSSEVDFWATFNAEDGAKTSAVVCTRTLFDAGLPVALDEFGDRLLIMASVPWDRNGTFPRDWTDDDTHGCRAYAEMSFIRPSKETVFDSVRFIANRKRFHPVRDYLRSLKWDGADRLPALANRYFGASDTPYARAVGTKFLIAAVARIMRPGAKVDTILILEGEQGKRKSTALRVLFGDDWFTDTMPDLTNKDSSMQIRGQWLVEFGELDTLSRGEVNAIKSYASRQTDRYRPPYGRTVINQPRQTVFAGTTNDDAYLRDPTGARRFWPITTGNLDIPALTADRDQIWAEAVARFDLGEVWWLDEAEEALARTEADARREVHPWEDRIQARIGDRTGIPFTFEYVCTEILSLPFDKLNPQTNKQVASALRGAGFRRQRLRSNGDRSYFYVKN